MNNENPTTQPAMAAARELIEKLSRDNGAYSITQVLDPKDRELLRQFVQSRDVYRDVLKYFGLELVNEAQEGVIMLMADEKLNGTKDCVLVRPIKGGSYAKDQSELAILRADEAALRAELAAAKEERDKYLHIAAERFHRNPAGESHEDIRKELAQLRADLAAKGEESQRYRTALEATNRVFFESKRQIAGEANEVRSLINAALSANAANKGEK